MLRAATVALALAPALARHRLEPADGRLIHAAGQDSYNFENYTAYQMQYNQAPAVSMFYLGLDSLNSTPAGTLAPWFANLIVRLEGDAAPDNAFIAVQLGLQLPLNGEERRVADGEYDAAIEALRYALVALARPVWLRIGYEMNGIWNNYTASTYVGAWRRITAVLRADPVLNLSVATVWDGSCDTKTDPTPYWPGNDDQVDWQGVNIFSSNSAPTHAGTNSCIWYWLTDSAAAGFPLLVGESTPRGRNTSDAGTLAAWHAPFLSLLQANEVIKLFSYIDENWDAVPRWKGWGESRIEVAHPNLQAAWRTSLAAPSLIHRSQKAALLALLGLPADVFEY